MTFRGTLVTSSRLRSKGIINQRLDLEFKKKVFYQDLTQMKAPYHSSAVSLKLSLEQRHEKVKPTLSHEPLKESRTKRKIQLTVAGSH